MTSKPLTADLNYDSARAATQAVEPFQALLAALRHPGETVWLQTLPDAKVREIDEETGELRKGKPGKWILRGVPDDFGDRRDRTGRTNHFQVTPLEQVSLDLRPMLLTNLAGNGLFFCVNVLKPQADRRSNANVERIAAVFVDLDGAPLPKQFPLLPTTIVESSPGRYHVYWAVDGIPVKEFSTIQKFLADHYGGDRAVCDPARLMRIPGTWHAKRDPWALARLINLNPDARYGQADLLQAWPSLEKCLLAQEERQVVNALRHPRRTVNTLKLSDNADLVNYAKATRQELMAHLATATDGSRNKSLFKAACRLGSLSGAGLLEDETFRPQLRDVALQIGLTERETEATIESGLNTGKCTPLDPLDLDATTVALQLLIPQPDDGFFLPSFSAGTLEGTDEAGAQILARNGLNSMLRYTPGLGWMTYQDGVWKQDLDGNRAVQIAGHVLRQVTGRYLSTLSDPGSERYKRVAAWVRKAGQVRGIRETLSAACGKVEFLTPADAWDAAPHLLNCRNATLDLRTGIPYPHRPEDLMTWQTGAAYDPDVKHPKVDALIALLQADGRADYLQRLFGSTLYGENPDERLTVLEGEGGTGKGTLVSAVMAVLGDYAGTLDISALLATQWGETGSSARPELLRLKGKRLVVTGEPPKGARFNASRVKSLTGNDRISVRALYSNQCVEFVPVFKLIVHTNYPIESAHDDTGMHRRIQVVPFRSKPTQADESFKRDLRDDPVARSALLNWAYAGFRLWWNDGCSLGACTIVDRATETYLRKQNPYERFADEQLSFSAAAGIPSSQLKRLFEVWLEEQGIVGPHVRVSELLDYLRSRGCTPRKGTRGVRVWQGVTVQTTERHVGNAENVEKFAGGTAIGATAATPPRIGWVGEAI